MGGAGSPGGGAQAGVVEAALGGRCDQRQAAQLVDAQTKHRSRPDGIHRLLQDHPSFTITYVEQAKQPLQHRVAISFHVESVNLWGL